MKKVYEAPKVEIEIYELDASIASNCAVVVNMGGPNGNGPDEPLCKDYCDYVGLSYPEQQTRTFAYNVNFWEHNCDCYTTAGGTGFFTS